MLQQTLQQSLTNTKIRSNSMCELSAIQSSKKDMAITDTQATQISQDIQLATQENTWKEVGNKKRNRSSPNEVKQRKQ